MLLSRQAQQASRNQSKSTVDGAVHEFFILYYLTNHGMFKNWDLFAGKCEYPWEFPAFGRFGCESDCGTSANTTKIAVNIRADFTGHPTISPRVLMSSVRWNLCLNDEERTARGEADLCWCA